MTNLAKIDQKPLGVETGEILGVEIKTLKTHADDRGFFREILRFNDPVFTGGTFAQWSHSRMQKNVVKAWHYHHVQTDWWYVAMGNSQTVLVDAREECFTFGKKQLILQGEDNPVLVKIPPGVLHGCKVLSAEAHLFYITSHTYDSNEEGRIPYNSELVKHDWGTDVIVAENDLRSFMPTSIRKKI
jgi:dTDP-4-dehydrorhamnose 3,5-epimerase